MSPEGDAAIAPPLETVTAADAGAARAAIAPADRVAFAVRVVVFLGVIGALTFGIHAYLWMRIVRDLAWPAPWDAIGTYAIFSLAFAIPVGGIAVRVLPPRIGTPIAWAIFLWLGVMFLLLATFAGLDALRWVASLVAPTSVARRVVSPKGNLGAAAFALSSAAIGMLIAFRSPALRRVRVKIDRLDPSQRGFRIVQWSDVHIGPTIGRAFIEKLVERTNALDPDLVVVTGDLVDGPVSDLAAAVEPMRRLRARHGVYFVTGNHEYISGVEPWLKFLPTVGLRVLRNERVRIGGANGFDLAGIDDHMASRFAPGHGPDLAKALAGRDESRPLVLLAHQPKAAAAASKAGVDLQLSGHTHGGQIFPFGLLVRLDQPYVSGLYRRGTTQLYVSEGTGYWGPPMRLGTRSELTEITLE